MLPRNKLLHSKLLRPHPPKIIRRRRLYPLLAQIPEKSLTTVVAGAGFGKTTLMAEACAHLRLDSVWYRLDVTDQDLTSFLAYLIEGLKQYFPEFGGSTLKRIEEAETAIQEREAILTAFIGELEETVERDIIIVLDDYHLIQDSDEIRRSLEFILDRLPPLVHIAVSSRTDPALHLSKLRAAGRVLDVREEDIAFTVPEVDELYSRLFNVSLRAQGIDVLHRKTEGWASGLVLFYHSARGRNPEEIEELLLKLKGSHKIISDYLEENVFDLQPDEIKDFLIKTSILSRISPEFCDQLLALEKCRKILVELEANHLFTFPFDEERRWYCYHHLFQEFLQTRLSSSLDRRSIRELHGKAAKLWEREGHDEEALKHYLNAEQFGKACALLRRMGGALIKEGRIQSIGSYIDKVPDRYLSKEPWIQYTRARALEIAGSRQNAIQIYRIASREFRRRGIKKGEGKCLSALGANYYITGDFPKAEKKLKQLLKQVTGNPRLMIEIMGNLIFVLSLQGKMVTADRYYDRAMSLLPRSANMRSLAWLCFARCFQHFFSGHFDKALELGRRTEELCRDNRPYHILANAWHGISCSLYFLGRHSEGLEVAKKGLRFVQEKGFWDASRAWHLTDAAMNYLGLGRISEALNDARESLELFRGIESLWGQSWSYYVLCHVCLKAGDVRQAEDYATAGIELARGMTGPLQLSILKVSLAECKMEDRRWKEARSLLDESARWLKDSRYYLSKAHLLYARLYWDQKRKKAALEQLLPALRLCAANHYDIWLIAEKSWIIPLLLEAYAIGELEEYLKTIFRALGRSARESLALLKDDKTRRISKAASTLLAEIRASPAPALNIHCLGRFSVFRGDEEIPAERWKSKKARTLFKYLVYARSKAHTSKEVLAELLWPEEDPQKTFKRFHVTLASLRRILEPEIEPGTPSSYLVRKEDSYSLHLGDGGRVDVDEFERELQLAEQEADPEKALVRFLNAEALYRGDFLEDDPFLDWCQAERASLRGRYLVLLTNIMQYFERKGDHHKCIEYAEKYLARDKCEEKIYQKLMQYYFQIGDEAMVTSTFQRCSEAITKELDRPLRKETVELYRELRHT